MVRALILAALAWLILAASPPPGRAAQDNQASTAQPITKTLPKAPATLQNTNEPSEHDEPCEKGQDNRRSDLCAQWKAADSASRAAQIALWIGITGLVIGALTLAAAGAAAKFAKDAATHTEAGAKAAHAAVEETRRVGEAQVRCYLSIAGVFMGLHNGNIPLITLRMRNAGQSPALKFKAKITLNWMDLKAGNLGREIVGGTGPLPATIPADSDQHGILYDMKGGFEPDELEQLSCGLPTLFLAARVALEWEDVFGRSTKLSCAFIGAFPLEEEGYWRLGSGDEALTTIEAERTSREKSREQEGDHPPSPDEGETRN